jgi:putative membrane protein
MRRVASHRRGKNLAKILLTGTCTFLFPTRTIRLRILLLLHFASSSSCFCWVIMKSLLWWLLGLMTTMMMDHQVHAWTPTRPQQKHHMLNQQVHQHLSFPHHHHHPPHYKKDHPSTSTTSPTDSITNTTNNPSTSSIMLFLEESIPNHPAMLTTAAVTPHFSDSRMMKMMMNQNRLTTTTTCTNLRALVVGVLALTSTPSLAEAAGTAAGGGAIPSALVAYAHYLSMLLMTAGITAERLTVKPNMSVEEEQFMGAADTTVGLSGVAVLISGVYWALHGGKGWEFFSHEPIFWLKMGFLGVFAGLSLFPTITIIQRVMKIRQQQDQQQQPKGGEGSILVLDPMSEELASRMKKVLNAELTALACIPLTATLMARGVAYTNDFPIETVGPVGAAVVTAVTAIKYAKDAITWKELRFDLCTAMMSRQNDRNL